MKKRIVIAGVLLLLCAGCLSGLSDTPEDPTDMIDPNQVTIIVNNIIKPVGETLTGVGIVTGNPVLVGLGTAMIMLGGIAISSLKRKEE